MKNLKSAVLTATLTCTVLSLVCGSAFAEGTGKFDITRYGALGDGQTVNTKQIQSAIDQCAAGGGGTLVIPKGEFISGSLFLKPGVNALVHGPGLLGRGGQRRAIHVLGQLESATVQLQGCDRGKIAV
jgi:hypothetical protein